MTSADFRTRIPTPHDVSSTMAPVRISPGMTHPPSRLYLSDIRHSVPCKFRALTILAASPRCNASYPLPVHQASALPSASSRFAVTRDTLAVQLTLPLAGRVEDFHLQVSAPCRAHQEKTRPHGRVCRLLHTPDLGAQRCELGLKPLITAIQMIDTLDEGLAFCHQAGHYQTRRGAQVCCHHSGALQAIHALHQRRIAVDSNIGPQAL